MNVLIISQCSKRALVETRRIVDQFAERKGERTWQTAITWEGLLTLRKMLRKTARRNTAVVCHWIKASNRTEVLWFVGNTSQFNDQGTIPTNLTARDILRSQDENQWHTTEDIALLAGIAGLFHDFGKANILFQSKLKPGYRGNIAEPYRHEWVSLRLFQAFVGQLSDSEWLEKLKQVTANDEPALLAALIKDGLDTSSSPFKSLPPLAKTVAWLVVSHHRLPCPKSDSQPQLEACEHWLEEDFNSSWNGSKAQEREWPGQEKRDVWQFIHGTPLRSKSWCAKAARFAERALRRPSLLKGNWMEDAFTLHLSRLALMLADHHYSAQDPTPKWQDNTYRAYANTYRETKQYKQTLDEHLIGVGINGLLLAKTLPTLRQTLPAITRHKGFKKRVKDIRFRWQDKAYELAANMRERSEHHGFFGINMASTGCGKTFANGRIMYGLANEALGCRFNVALGLRTLTLQTGNALRDRLKLQDDDLAVIIGSQAVRDLHEFNNTPEKVRDSESAEAQSGSESAEELLDEQQYIHYEGALDNGRISRWLGRNPRAHQMVSAPILVSTIDHLIPATEGDRGGKQIAPMLRLLTSDLVLDEPDDFDLADLPALTRLVNWAAMLGSRVLISSATLPPALVNALFAAYLAGRHAYQRAIGEPGRPLNVCCAWFDEYTASQSDHAEPATFADAHQQFVQGRIAELKKQPAVRQAQLLPVHREAPTIEAVISALAQTIHDELHALHRAHHQMQPETGRRVSVGLVRMANINPMVAIAQQLLTREPQPNHRIHYCIYHSQHPLAVRSTIERELDTVLTRHDPEAIWRQPVIKQALHQHSEENQIFVVLATPVAEVGRDHDYDWAIAEPSSMRSLIQLAGRIWRHRPPQMPHSPNLTILNGNVRALRAKHVENIAYTQPGFESEKFKLRYKDLKRLLRPEQYQQISALPRIIESSCLQPEINLVDLEHAHLKARLFGSQRPLVLLYAALWWQKPLHWNFELQRQTRFRASELDETFVLYLKEEGDEPKFSQWHDNGELKDCPLFEKKPPIEKADRVSTWGYRSFADIALELANTKDMELEEVSRRYGVLQLRKLNGSKKWCYHPILGVYSALE
jgi:CRISPR-associated endonuclease/helicase Cas3